MSTNHDLLRQRATSIRRTVVQMCQGRGQGYVGQGMALADTMATLYFDELRREPDGSLRDVLVLSTGHSAIAVYAAQHELGAYELDELRTYGMDGSRIEESPLEGTPGFSITGGSLGQGLSQAVGMALAERLHGSDRRIHCLLSDGELQEGQTWEAAMSAGHYGLDNLVALVDNNRIQADGATAEVMGVEPVDDKFAAFGFATRRVDAHDVEALTAAFAAARAERGRPTALVLDTIPGHGAPVLAEYSRVHYIRAGAKLWEQALAEVGSDVPAA